MRKIRNLVIGGIQTHIFGLIFVTVLLLSVAFMAVQMQQTSMLAGLSADTSRRQQESIAHITGETMHTVIDRSIGRSAELEAALANEMFSGLETRVRTLGQYAGNVFGDARSYTPLECSAPDPARDGEVTAQLLLADDVNGADISTRSGAAARLVDIMAAMFSASDEANSCFVALPEGAFIVVDDRSASKFGPDGAIISYDPRTRPWYMQAVEAGELIFTDVETDAFTGDAGIVCAMPVYIDGELAAVVGSDLFLTSMREYIQASAAEGAFSFVVNQRGHVVFSPMESGEFQVLSSGEAPDLRDSDNAELSAFISDALRGITEARLVQLADSAYYMASAPVNALGWALISALDKQAAEANAAQLTNGFQNIQQSAIASYTEKTNRMRIIATLAFLALMLLVLAGALALGRRIVRPLNAITQGVTELSAEKPVFDMRDAYRTGDEIEVLADSFARITRSSAERGQALMRANVERERADAELRTAYQIQESMLPNVFPAFPGRAEFDIYAAIAPARAVGGDFYDFYLIDDDHLCIVLADVSGTGVPAALFMMAMKIMLKDRAMFGLSPAEMLARTNEALCANNALELFVTVWLGVIELSTGRLTAVNAGHKYPLLQHRGGKFGLFKDKHSFVVGSIPGVQYSEYTLQLEPGDKLFLYTDGLPEAVDKSNDMFGAERALDALNRDPEATPQQLITAVRAAVDDFSAGVERFDDMTMLCFEYLNGDPK